jgi:hypothetical protein
LQTVTTPLRLGSPLVASGSGFRGLSEAAGGQSTQSATNYPLVQLRRLDSEQVHWLVPDPDAPFSDTLYISLGVQGILPGPASVTMFVNGIPGTSRLITVGWPRLYLPVVYK